MINISPDLIAVLDAMTMPAGICDGGGRWLAVNELLAAKMPNDKVAGLFQLMANDQTWEGAASRIHRRRRAKLFSDKLAEPFADRIILSTRLQLSSSSEPSFLIELRAKTAWTKAFGQISTSQKETLSYKHDRFAATQRMRRAVARSYRDPLTEIANRRAFDTYVAKLWASTVREQANLSLLYVDVDYFKDVNDQLGHARGDEILIALAMCLDGATRSRADFAGRYGGEEFVFLLPNTNSHEARNFAQSVLEQVRALKLPHPTGKVSSVITVSIGCATVSPTPSDKLSDLIDRADKALYLAKESGRDRVEVHQCSSLSMIAEA